MSTKLETSDRLEIYESRIRLAIFAIIGTVMTAGALFMTGACIGVVLGFLGSPNDRALVAPILVFLIGTVGIILFGSATVRAVVRWLGPRQAVLFMTRDGFKDIRISADWIPWSTVLSLKNYRGKGVVVDVDPDFLRKNLRLGFVTRFARRANGLLGNRGLWIAAFPLGISSRELLDVMESLYRPGTGHS